MAAITSLSTTYYSNISTTASTTATTFTGCGPCRYLMVHDPAFAYWNTAASNISALRTIQEVFDQNYNTTSTSVNCNTSVISEYGVPRNTGDPYKPSYGVNDECDVVATYSVIGRLADNVPQYVPVTVTVTGSTGQALFLGPQIVMEGEVSTTDSDGSPSCITGSNINLPTFIGSYTDRMTKIPNPYDPADDNPYVNFLLLPDLSKYVSGYDAFIEQCTYINVGGTPKALTPAKEIILPRSTIPASQSSVSTTTTADNPPDSETRPPVTSDVPVLPVTTTPPNEEPTTRPSTSSDDDQVEPTSRPAPGDDEDDTPGNSEPSIIRPTQPTSRPAQPSDENPPELPSSQGSTDQAPTDQAPTNQAPTNQAPTNQAPTNQAPTNQAPTDQLPTSAAEPVETSSPSRNPVASPTTGPSSQGAVEAPPGSSQPPPVIVPIEPSASQTQPSAETSPDIEIVPVGSPEASNGGVVTSRVTSVQGVGSIGTVSDESDAYVIGSATTVTAGGSAATIAGTVYSALPSGSGVAAINEPSDPFASYIAVGVSGQSIGIASDETNEDEYVLENGATLVAGQEAAVVSGTTFTALATGGGVVAIADGSSSTLPEPTLAAGSETTSAYVIGGGVTISQGGSAAIVSGTTYSALASGLGVLAVADGQTRTLDAAELGQTSPSVVLDAYIIGGSSTISAGGSDITVAGTTYSALPSDLGVVAIADGATTTIAKTAIGQLDATPTTTYIVAGSATISAGGSATAISGTTYSVLPSGAGVVVVADGESSTVGPDGSTKSTSTGTADEDEVESFTGSASLTGRRLGGMRCWAAGVAVLILLM